MKLSEIVNELERIAPRFYQESYDNSGLIVGDKNREISSAVVCLDSTLDVLQEAKAKGANLVIAHHPIVFKGLKSFTGKNYVEKTVMYAIKHDIAIYAIHTNLDNVLAGVNDKIAEKLNLENRMILSQKSGMLKKLVFFCPAENAEEVKNSLFAAGAGTIGNYDECSFSQTGEGTFKPVRNADPAEGELDKLSKVEELRIEVLVHSHKLGAVLSALQNTHPYEEVAHEVYPIENTDKAIGAGLVGELKKEMSLMDFLALVKKQFNTGTIKYTAYKKPVKRVALCGGSGSFLLGGAKAAKADVFLTSDFKYHEYFDAEEDLSIVDIGHYESEQFTIELIQGFLIDKFPKFAAHLTEVNTNPVKYF